MKSAIEHFELALKAVVEELPELQAAIAGRQAAIQHRFEQLINTDTSAMKQNKLMQQLSNDVQSKDYFMNQLLNFGGKKKE